VFAQSCSTDECWGSGVWIGVGGVRGWRWDQACSEVWGGGWMLHSGCCLALKSHLAVTIFPHPEGGGRTGGRGWWDGLDLSYGPMRLASWAPKRHGPLTYQTPAQLGVRKDLLHHPGTKSFAFNLYSRVVF